MTAITIRLYFSVITPFRLPTAN